jgi:hypothetical protein
MKMAACEVDASGPSRRHGEWQGSFGDAGVGCSSGPWRLVASGPVRARRLGSRPPRRRPCVRPGCGSGPRGSPLLAACKVASAPGRIWNKPHTPTGGGGIGGAPGHGDARGSGSLRPWVGEGWRQRAAGRRRKGESMPLESLDGGRPRTTSDVSSESSESIPWKAWARGSTWQRSTSRSRGGGRGRKRVPWKVAGAREDAGCAKSARRSRSPRWEEAVLRSRGSETRAVDHGSGSALDDPLRVEPGPSVTPRSRSHPRNTSQATSSGAVWADSREAKRTASDRERSSLARRTRSTTFRGHDRARRRDLCGRGRGACRRLGGCGHDRARRRDRVPYCRVHDGEGAIAAIDWMHASSSGSRSYSARTRRTLHSGVICRCFSRSG